MKIIFIEPRAKSSNVYSRLHMPLLGPIYLGTILKKRGHEVEIYNEDIYEPDYEKLEADIVGISILTSTSLRGYEIAKKFPRQKVIIGGVHASLLPEEALRYARQVVIGEADEVIADLVEGRIKEEIVRGIPVNNLDSLPYPDFSLIKGIPANKLITPVSTSRGCPYDCNFCSVTKLFGRKYRFRSAENVIGELKASEGKDFFFCDDNFTANPQRTMKLLELMAADRIGNWAAQVRCEAAKDSALLRLMRKAGCQVVCVGFESVNQKTLHSYDKKQTVAQIEESIRLFHAARIKIHGMFVLGSDDDSSKTVWETLRFAISKKIDTIQMMILTPFPGTKIHDYLESEKRIFTRDWNLYDGQHIVFKPKLLSAHDLQVNVLAAYRRFYSLARSFSSLLKWQFRNALFNFMGYVILREWTSSNHKMNWIKS